MIITIIGFQEFRHTHTQKSSDTNIFGSKIHRHSNNLLTLSPMQSVSISEINL